ncbi:MAG: thiamine pyrophosphate-dependent enzyme, partial [Rhodospirillales bacterium]
LEAMLEQLTAQCDTKAWPAQDLDQLKAVIHDIYRPQPGGFNTATAVDILSAELDHGTRIAVDAGAHMFATIGRWPATRPFGILKSNGLSTMGYALPAAIASALTDKETPVVAVTGDGGLAMCIGELATAREHDLDLTVCVINDSALSLIDIKQQRQQRKSLGVRYPEHDFAAIARAYGWHGERADDPDQLQTALKKSGRKLIDVRVDAAGYGDDLERLRG